MKTQFASIIVTIMSFLVLAPSSHAADDGCVSNKCHATMGTAKWVHGPVGVGDCTVCHQTVEGKDHEFTFPLEKEELCFACHDEKRDMMSENYQHTPVAEGNCTGCHDPHQSEHRFQLKGHTSELCFTCHEQTAFEGVSVHDPVDEGECSACHNPHASPYPQQLRAEPPQLCFGCHEDRTDIQETLDSHAPVAESCTNCHNPHVGNSEFMLPAQPPDLCIQCHENIADFAVVSNQHEPVQSGQCMACHNVHGSKEPMLLNDTMTKVCYGCHEEFKEYVVAQDFLHGPIRENDCIACHSPHGSDNHRMLKKYFPKEFYVAYAEENYAICFECHNSQIALEAETETLTDFRDGNRNLHYLHVNKTDKGRSCRACHQVHASSQEKHIRHSVPYGKLNWDLPVNFTKTESGGSCQVGCHKPKEYKR